MVGFRAQGLGLLLVFCIPDAPWPPVETRASMMQAATAALSSLLSLLRAPAVTMLPSQVAISLINRSVPITVP